MRGGKGTRDLAFSFEPLSREDLPFLLEVRNECRDWLHDNRRFTLVESQVWFAETNPDFYIIRHEGTRIGYFRLSNQDSGDASIFVGADLHREFRGRGLARRAYEAFMPVIRDRYQVATLRLEVLSHNTGAYRLYQELGFVEVERKEHFVTRNGIAVDSIVMAMEL